MNIENRNTGRCAAAGALAALLCLSPAQGETLTVPDFSFEDIVLAPGGYTSDLSSSPWLDNPSANPAAGFVEHIPGFSSDGNNHAGLESGHTLNLFTPHLYLKDSIYALRVALGNRNGWTNSDNLSFYGFFNGAVNIGNLYPNASELAAVGTFVDAPPFVVYPSLTDAHVGARIGILLTAGGSGRSHFDNVRLEALYGRYDVTAPGDSVVGWGGTWPSGEEPDKVIDDQVSTKYLNFQGVNSGFTVQPSIGSTLINGITITSGNDEPQRDPVRIKIEGSNATTGFATITEFDIPNFTARNQKEYVFFEESRTPYLYYRVIFTSLRGGGADSYVQVAEMELLGRKAPAGWQAGAWGVREIYGHPTLANSLVNAEAIARTPESGSFVEYRTPVINHFDAGSNGDVGYFSGGRQYGVDNLTAQGMANGDDNQFVLQANGMIRIDEEDDYTFGFSSDDGARLRIFGVPFLSSTRLNTLNPSDPAHLGDMLMFSDNTGDSRTLGVVHLTPGTYELEFLTWENTGGAHCEVFAARGAHTDYNDQFQLIGYDGDDNNSRSIATPAAQVLAPGFDVTVIYDGANTLNAAMEDMYGEWSGNAPGNTVFTETVDRIVYHDPDGGGDSHGETQRPFPGGSAGTGEDFFAFGAKGKLQIDEASEYTFLVLGDDGSRFRLQGTRGWLASGIGRPIESGFQVDGCCADGMGHIFLEPGTYDMELIWNEIAGGAYVSLWIAEGRQTVFDATKFRVLSTAEPVTIPTSGLPLVGDGFGVPNDDFADAQRAQIGTQSGSNAGATLEPGEQVHNFNYTRTVWWNWTAPADGDYTINLNGSDYDSTLQIFTGNTVDTLTTLRATDRVGNGTERVTVAATAGTTYHIAVGGYLNAQGNIRLNIAQTSSPTPNPPVNDAFAAATVLNSGSEPAVYGTANNESATSEAGEPSPHGLVNTAWWTWTAPDSGTYLIDTAGSSFHTVVAVYTGAAVDGLTLVASHDDGLGGQSKVTLQADAGTTYRIAVGGHGGTGDIVLSIVNIDIKVLATMFDSGTRSFTLRWSSHPFQTYRIETTTDLEEWIEAGVCESSVGTETEYTMENIPLNLPQIYFRVLRE